MEQNRAVLILILLIIFFFPDTSTPPNFRKRIVHERYSLEVLRNSTFGHPGNLTGLLSSPNDTTGSTTTIPAEVVRDTWRNIRRALLRHYIVAQPKPSATQGLPTEGTSSFKFKRDLPVYQNTTGSVLGEWRKVVYDSKLPTTALPNVTYPANLKKLSTGKLILAFEDATDPDSQGKALAQVKMTLRIRDRDGKQEAAVSLSGVHFTDTGEMVAATTSERFAGFFAIPHLTMSEVEFNQSKELLVPSIEKTVKEMEKTQYLEAPWLPSADAPTSKPQCEYIMYTQLHPVDSSLDERYENLEILREIEHEMRFPTGSSLPPPPPLRVSTMIYSPNCGFVLVSDNLEGKKLWPLYYQATHVALGAALLATAQVWMLIRQMNESNTLSTISRVSFWTITMMAVVDGYCFFMFMVAAVLLGPGCFLPMVAVSFCYLMLSAVFGMRFLVYTYRVQRQSAPASAPTPPAPAPQTAGGLPVPATAEPQTTVIITPNQAAATDEEVNSEIGALHIKFYFVLVGVFFFTLYVSTWPPFFRDILVHILLIIVNSYWVPQVHRNIMRGCRKALQWEFVFGMSGLRLLPVFYLYLYPKNIFLLEPNPQAAVVIVGWVWIQCLALLSQDVFGPRFLIPSHSLPPVYDYHSALPMRDEETAQEMGSPIDGGRGRSFDCVVCMQTVEVPTAGVGDGRDGDHGGGSAVGLLGRRAYMVTPCKHVFHTHCLEGWMRFRLQCPICRNPLPAV